MANFDEFKRSLIQQESGNDFNAVNKRTGALGYAQVMPQNLVGWGKNAGRKNFGWDYDALGRDISPQEFLTNPNIQQKIVEHQLLSAYQRYGAEGAARWWYSNSPNPSNKRPAKGEPTPNEYAMQVLGRTGKTVYSGGSGGGGTMGNKVSVDEAAQILRDLKKNAAPVAQTVSVDEAAQILRGLKGQNPAKLANGNFKAIDPRKEAERQVAREVGGTSYLDSAILGFADFPGAGVIAQGTKVLQDAGSSVINKVAGTNLRTDNYEQFNKQFKDAENFHNLRREEAGQGYDHMRLATGLGASLGLGVAAKGFEGVPILSKAGAKVLGQNATLGAAIGGTSGVVAPEARAKNAAIGAVAGGAGGVAGQKIGQGVAQLNRTLNPAARQQAQVQLAQQVDNELTMALQQHNISLGDLSTTVQAGLRQDVAKALSAGKTVNAQAVARKAVLDKLGLKGTKAQITGNPQLWQKQAELSKIQGAGDPLRDKLVQDNVQLAGLLDDVAARSGGNAPDQYGAIKNASDALLAKNTQNKQAIRSAYDNARNASGNDVVLDGRGFTNDAITALEQNYAMSSMPVTVGKIIKDIEKNPSALTFGKSEELIKILNREYKSSLVNGQPSSSTYAIGVVRDALTGRQQQAAQGILANGGNDAVNAWQTARQLYSANAERIKGLPLLQDALKGVESDKLFTRHILNGNAAQIKNTADELATNNPQALADIKQQLVQFIGSKAINQNGQFSPAGMKRALDALGDRRLNALFNPDEVIRLKDIQKAGHYLVTQPAHSNVNNSNTASAVINLASKFSNIPYIKEIVLNPVQRFTQSLQANSALKPTVAGERVVRQLSGAEKELIEHLERMGVVVTPQMFNK